MNEAAKNIKVVARLRPLLWDEVNKTVGVACKDTQKIVVFHRDNVVQATFDRAFDENSSQEDIFSWFESSADEFVEGKSCSIMAYGHTGAGKTFTMYGGDWAENIGHSSKSRNRKQIIAEEQFLKSLAEGRSGGLVLRMVRRAFEHKSKQEQLEQKPSLFTLKLYQIYNEKILDLLNISDELKVKEDQNGRVHIEGITEYSLDCYEEFLLLLARAESNRFKRNTALNESSSRSHTILEVSCTLNGKVSKLQLCDLAGSEKFTDGQLKNKGHMIETRNINQSLTHLGRVVKALYKQSKDSTVLVPYRDSKLTRVLQNSLSSESNSFILAALSPRADHAEETMATLKFTKNASRIVLKSVLETKPPAEELSSLKDEVKFLKDILHIKRFGGGISELIYKVKELQTENDKLKKLSVLPKPQLLQLMNQNLELQQELTKYRNQSPSEELENGGFETSENQSLVKESAGKNEPQKTYIINSFVGNTRPSGPKSEALGNAGLVYADSKEPGEKDDEAAQEEATERRKDYRIATVEPNSPIKSHPALLSPREDSEGLQARVTAKQYRGSGLELDQAPKLKFALRNLKLKSPMFSAKSGIQSQIDQSHFSASENPQFAQKYPQLNATASKNYLRSQLWEPSSKQTSSVFSTGKPVSVKRGDSHDALVLVEDSMQKRMAKHQGTGQPGLKHSKFSESPRAKDNYARHLDGRWAPSREARPIASGSPNSLAQWTQAQAAELQLQKTVKTADLLRRLQEISALGFEPTQTLSPKKNNFLDPGQSGHLFPQASRRSPTSSPSKPPQIRSSQPTSLFLGKVEFNMREMKRELAKLRFG